jgi:hypothetical protein
MKKLVTFLGILILLLLWNYPSISFAQTISFTGSVMNSSGQPVSGATIIQAGNPSVNTTSDGSGNFTLAGLPSGTPYSLKISAQNYADTYTNNMTHTGNQTSTRPFTLHSTVEVSQWGLTPGKGAIAGTIADQSNPQTGLQGVVVSAASAAHPGTPYPVVYPQDAGQPGNTSTFANGRFMVPNVDDSDTVTVTASKTGWSFGQRVFVTHGNGISQGVIYGTPGISASGTVQEAGQTPLPLSGVTAEQAANPSISTTTNVSGNFTLIGLPSGQNFHIKLTKNGYVPSYTRVFNDTQTITMLRPYSMFTAEQMAGFGSAPGKGVMRGVIVDQTDPLNSYIGGVTVSYTSSQGRTYRVTYTGGGQATAPDGRFSILDIEDADIVTVIPAKDGWTFPNRDFYGHTDGVIQSVTPGTGSGGGGDENTLSLSAGWNFFSIPKVPVDTAIESVLSDVLADVLVVYGFDNETKTWMLYRPSAGDNTLTALEQGKGYWLYLRDSGSIDMSSWDPGSTTVSLYEGWNLVGYSGTSALVETSLTGVTGWVITWTWFEGSWQAKHATIPDIPVLPFTMFEQTKAYWVYMGQGTSGDWNQ